MRKVFWALAGLVVVVLGGLAGVLAFNAPVKPESLASISEPFSHVDFSDLPTEQTYVARDGVKLGYRAYEGSAAQVVVLIHGSSETAPHASARQGAARCRRFRLRAGDARPR